MPKVMSEHLAEMIALQPAIAESHERSNRAALLEHARMGRSVCFGDANGGVIWITPEEIFARYGLDENGKPKPA